MLINKREETGLKHLSHPKVFIELTSNTGNIYTNIEKYNPNEKRKSLIVFDDMIDNTISKKKLNPLLAASYYHVTREFQSESALYNLPECQGTA